MADAKLGGRVSADIEGFFDDDSGTITGTAGALIERPDHIARHVLTDRCGLSAARIDDTAYSAAGSDYDANGFTLAFPVLMAPNVRKLLNRIARQAKTMETWAAGVHRLHYIADNPSADFTIRAHMIDQNQIGIKYTKRAEIENALTARYNRDWSGYSDDADADRDTVSATDAGSIDKYGRLEADERSYPYITTQSQAQAVIDWEIAEAAAPRLVIELTGGYFLTAIERGDIVNFSFESGDELDAALINLVTPDTDKFRIIDATRRPDAAVQVQMVAV